MSFLSELIKDVRRTFRTKDSDLKIAVTKFEDSITAKLRELSEAENLRIYDGEDGGVLRGPKGSRSNREIRKTRNLLCQKQYLDAGRLEVPYFRALFNSPGHEFTPSADPGQIIRLIGYESPLMRKREGNKNPEISSRTISCDLVGLTCENQILCIEGKVNPHNPATDIVYGLLESFAYGVCVDYFLSEEKLRSEFENEVRACVKEFNGTDMEGLEKSKLTAAFSLAAPKEYFAEYLDPKQMTKRKSERGLREARRLLGVFEGNGPAWAGFLIMEPTCCVESFEPIGEKTTKNGKNVEPHFKSESLMVAVAKDMELLKKTAR